MSKYVIDEETLNGLGDAIRSVTGSTKKLTPDEMMAEIRDILNGTTFMLVDADGNEYAASYVNSDVVFTATANDIRKGCTALTGEGLTEGSKEIPSYNTTEGTAVIMIGSKIKLPDMPHYDYTKLQALVCEFNTKLMDSVATDYVCIEGSIYPVNSTVAISQVTTHSEDRSIDFGITNDSGNLMVIRYFMYKEIY